MPSKSDAPKKARRYSIPKSKVRAKCQMLLQTARAFKFCAFYSVSFPAGLSEDDAYVVLNYWLTFCRKHCGLKSYLWVAERQGNGTIHYHILTPDYMEVRGTNDAMRKILTNFATKYKREWRGLENYNGVDVRSIWHTSKAARAKGYKRVSKQTAARRVALYLTKYISKSSDTFSHLAWHCSRCVSALATSVRYHAERLANVVQWCEGLPQLKGRFETDFAIVWLLPFEVDMLRDTGIYERNNDAFEYIREGGRRTDKFCLYWGDEVI